MTEFLAVPAMAASIAAIAPLLGAVYQAYVKKPIRVKDEASIINAFKRIREESTVTMFKPGTYEVTPDDARNNYTIAVMGDTNEDATGILQVTDPNGRGFQVLRSSETGQVTTTGSDGRAIQLNYNNAVIISEEVNDRGAIDIFGIIIHRPAGEPVFPKE